jgi:pimeloyl-ACP methyl ester carboxylesterase
MVGAMSTTLPWDPPESVTLAGGATIRYRDLGEGPVLVFVHGVLVNGILWRDVAPRLARRFRCIVPDWPFGSHAVPVPGHDLTPAGCARMLAEFLDALDLEDVTLVGNDSGGAVSQIVSVHHPERLGRLVLTSCDAYDNFFPPLFRPLQTFAKLPGVPQVILNSLRLKPLQRLPNAFGWVAKHAQPQDVVERYIGPARRDAAVRDDLKRFLVGVDAKYTIEAAARFGEFRKPVLVLWAREDKIFPVEHAERLAHDYPDARLEFVEDSYAFIPEDQPAWLAERIAEFAGAAAGP